MRPEEIIDMWESQWDRLTPENRASMLSHPALIAIGLREPEVALRAIQQGKDLDDVLRLLELSSGVVASRELEARMRKTASIKKAPIKKAPSKKAPSKKAPSKKAPPSIAAKAHDATQEVRTCAGCGTAIKGRAKYCLSCR